MRYKNPAATATIIVERKEKILLVRRKKEPYQRKLSLPGGFLNCDEETLERTIQRELYEETGLKVRQKDLYLLCVNSSPRRDPRGHVIDHVFYTSEATGEAKAGDDAAEIVWKAVEDMPKRLAFDHSKNIRRYKLIRGCKKND